MTVSTTENNAASVSLDDYLYPFPDVVEELTRRQQDTELRRRIEEYLANDIPEYMKDGPALYISRHLATPNFETLRFIHLANPYPYKVVIGEDLQDKFVGHNELKWALGKLPICEGVSIKDDGTTNERYRHITIVDFNTANGKKLIDIRTTWGEPLASFHHKLFARISGASVRIEDDSAWVDRHNRGDLLEHYKQFLALFIIHGVLFEDYILEDKHEGAFVCDILDPAFKFVKERFGCQPLIARLNPTSVESCRYWVSYPSEVADFVTRTKSLS